MMNNLYKYRIWIISFLLLLLLLIPNSTNAEAIFEPDSQEDDAAITMTLVGKVVNTQDGSVEGANVTIHRGIGEENLARSDQEQSGGRIHTDEEGFFVAEFEVNSTLIDDESFQIEISKPGFRTVRQPIVRSEILCEDDHCIYRMPDIVLGHISNSAFIIATVTFVGVFVLIALQVFHDTVSAFIGATVMLGLSYVMVVFIPDFWIISFELAIDYIDFDVIFLILTLMIVVSIIGGTGIFQWLALTALRTARGHAWRLAVILMLATAVMSAILNNVTIMLLMAPITIEIALMLEINPAALLIPEVMASNIGGIATLIGDPPNTVIGSFAGIGFNQFVVHMGPVAVIATLTLIVFVFFVYRKEYASARKTPSRALLEHLELDAQITDPITLRRSLIVVLLMIVLFFMGEVFKIPPSVVGLIGATTLLVWVRPNIEDMLREVDWTTLVFFMCLFIVVGGVTEVGLIELMAGAIANLAGDNPILGSQVVIWFSTVASAIVNNIPFTTAALPIAAFLTQATPSITNNVLYWSLSIGANLGGNATYIGSAPNVVAVGVLERAGHKISFLDWLKIGVPATFFTVVVSSIWIWIRYFWLQF
jgi:Na+/H+ antiporter NhaD/arsenite permease-like protein